MLLSRLHDLRRSDEGFSLVAVLVTLLLTGLIVTGAYAAADGDITGGRKSQDRKVAYAAAEAGVNWYRFQVNKNPDFWTTCENVGSPVSAVRTTGADARRWKTLPDSNAQYTVEMLPANGAAKCLSGQQATVIDQATGMFRIRVTGRSRNQYRSIIASFRRKRFLDFVYFTMYETGDPSTYSDPASATTDCSKPRPARAGYCSDIQFADADQVNGPLHTNDNLLVCDTPEFGRTGFNDSIEVSGTNPASGHLAASGCSDSPVFHGPFTVGVAPMTMPSDNAALKTVAAGDSFTSGATTKTYSFSGATRIRLNGSTMTITNGGTTYSNVPWPANGVIYANAKTGCAPPNPTSIRNAYPAESTDPCGTIYVSGSYSKSLTIGADTDVVVSPTPGSNPADGNVTQVDGSDAILGLVANNFVRIAHPGQDTYDSRGRVNGCTNVTPTFSDVRVDAAILALKHSFIVDNYDCGAKLGNLTINGAIAQPFRGAVGTSGSSGTGFIKNYNYDQRLQYRSPPYFLQPADAAWSRLRLNEQVPATK